MAAELSCTVLFIPNIMIKPINQIKDSNHLTALIMIDIQVTLNTIVLFVWIFAFLHFFVTVCFFLSHIKSGSQ